MRTLTIAILVGCVSCSPAWADLSPAWTHPAVEQIDVHGGSWFTTLHLNSSSSIDLIAVQMTSSDPFSVAAFTNFTEGGWSQYSNDGLLAVASGPGTQDFMFDLHFSGNVSDPVVFQLAAFEGNTLLGSLEGTWTPGLLGTLTFAAGEWTPSRNSLMSTPVPDGFVLAALGLGLLVPFHRRILV